MLEELIVLEVTHISKGIRRLKKLYLGTVRNDLKTLNLTDKTILNWPESKLRFM